MDLKMEVSQNLALSQKMIQSAEILQMGSQELELYIKELAIENPVVDLEEDHMQADREQDIQRKLEWLKSSDEQNRVYYSQDYQEDEESKEPWNISGDMGEDLYDYLMAQLMTAQLSSDQQAILDFMIQCLDSRGYLDESLERIASQLNVSEEQIEDALWILQGLEPAGVGARDLKECLLLQCDRLGNVEELVKIMITHHLELVGKNQLHVIARKGKVSIEDVHEACEVIKSLNPKPGNSFSSREHLKYITPDVTIVKLGGYYEILLNEYNYPRMSVNNYYLSILKSETDQEAKNYVGDKVRQAEWIMNCISQRNKTLLNVTKAIIDKQEAFFSKGQGHLVPMRLADVAEAVEVHESTVSRAVRDKYLQCSWGVYPMNYFFSKGIDTTYSQGKKTPEDIKNRIREIVEAEDKKKPYSDRVITEKLNEEGIVISRRTVAKYREAIGIKDAGGRKNFI